MNEIERAIELLEEISYNMGQERDTEFAGDTDKFHALCDKKDLIDLATDLIRAELSRQENAPLTWNDVILKQYKENVSRHASSRISGEIKNGKSFYYRMGCEHRYDTLCQAMEDEIAFLNSLYTEGATK